MGKVTVQWNKKVFLVDPDLFLYYTPLPEGIISLERKTRKNK